MSRHTFLPRHILLLVFLSVTLMMRMPLYANPESSLTPGSASAESGSVTPQFVDPELGEEDWDDTDLQLDLGQEDDPWLNAPHRHIERPDSNRNWWHLLKKGKLNTADTTIRYPKFLNFCMKVYRWADKAFNSYDTTYVVGTGKKWKARILTDGWMDSYYINPGKKMPIRIMSDPYFNVGGYIQYMAVSLGYSVDMNNLFGNDPANHHKFEYSFSCARFNIEGHYWKNTAATYIRTFGNYNNGHIIKRLFDGVQLSDFEVYGYYFFNNKKFAWGAAYNYAKIQKKSAGTAVIGFGYTDTDITMDLNKLPEELSPYLNIPPEVYHFRYHSYSIISGYSFNWVWNKHLLFNVSAFPGVGINITQADNHSGAAKSLALNIRWLASLTYNLDNFFICAVGRLNGNWYYSGGNTLFSSVENGQLSVGIRF